VKTGLIKLVHNIFSFIFCFNHELLKSKCREISDDLHLFVFTPCKRQI
jgi:hypothetical protein